jgi:proteic killer suppression protein
MIRSFADPRVERLFRDGICPARWQTFETIAKRKLDMLDAATKLSDLRNLNRPKALSGNDQGQHHDKFRVRYQWTDQGPTDVEVVE